MAYDIHGNALRPGHCEVHPDVAEPWPCSTCQTEQPVLLSQRHSQVFEELERLDTFVRALDRRELDRTALYALEPWRLATMAKLAYRCGVMTRGERDEVVRQVQVGIRPVRIPVAYR